MRTSTITHWARVRKSGFPAPIKLHAAAEPRWRLSDIEEFVDRAAKRQLHRPPQGRLLQGSPKRERVRLNETSTAGAGDDALETDPPSLPNRQSIADLLPPYVVALNILAGVPVEKLKYAIQEGEVHGDMELGDVHRLPCVMASKAPRIFRQLFALACQHPDPGTLVEHWDYELYHNVAWSELGRNDGYKMWRWLRDLERECECRRNEGAAAVALSNGEPIVIEDDGYRRVLTPEEWEKLRKAKQNSRANGSDHGNGLHVEADGD